MVEKEKKTFLEKFKIFIRAVLRIGLNFLQFWKLFVYLFHKISEVLNEKS